VTEPRPLLSVRNLRVEFNTRRGTLVAVDDVSFDIAPGEVLGRGGRIGARQVDHRHRDHRAARAARPHRRRRGPARRRAHRQPAAGGDAQDPRRRIGAIFQDPLTSLNPLYTIGRQITETIQQHLPMNAEQARSRAIELLGEVGIPAPSGASTTTRTSFSGGMRQRVVIALALCANPRLIIADEPTTALDVSIQAQIIQLLKGLCRDTAPRSCW
jgi:peptide/nickel transport system ATP-binding protein